MNNLIKINLPGLNYIPSHWSLGSLRYFGKLYGGLKGKTANDFDEGEGDGRYSKRYVPFTNIANNLYVNKEDLKLVFVQLDEQQNHVKKGDLLILMSSENYDDLGKSSLVEFDIEDGLFLNSFCKGYRITNPNLNSRFLNFSINSPYLRQIISVGGNGFTRINLRQSYLLSTRFPLPPMDEQVKISNHLDNKINLINKIVFNQEKQIEKLKEYKQSLISEVVTKGLEPNLPMKDSGIEWIGKIPNRWEVKTLSILLREHNIKNKGLLNKNLLSLSYGRIVEKDIQTKDGLLPENFEGYNIISSGDIVLRLTDLQNDHKSLRVGFCSYNGIITSAYVTLRARTLDIFSKYYYYLLHSFDIKKGFYGMGDGVRQNLTYDGLRTLPLLLPPKEVQNQISHFLDLKCSSIDKVIKIKEQKIQRLNEYKKSLIYEYVTGKRTVES